MDPRVENGRHDREVDRRETWSLIGSDKVEGTAVYGANDEKIGKIERVMIEKVSGKVSYAVLSFGGFLGIGDEHYPVPWSMLTYDESLGGYRTNLAKSQLEDAPRYRSEDEFDWANADATSGIYNYYGIQPYPI